MRTTKTTKSNSNSSEEYYRLVNQIHCQLKSLEKIMKHCSFNDSLYFIQLTKKCFENEIAKGLHTHQ